MAPHLRHAATPRVLGELGGVGCFRLDFAERLFRRNYREPVLLSCTHGAGLRLALAAELSNYETIGPDVVARCVNDLAAQGAEPLFLMEYLLGAGLDTPAVERLLRGLAEGCVQAGCALLGGRAGYAGRESPPATATPALPRLPRDLAAFAVGVCELRRLVSGERADAGDLILGLAAAGLPDLAFERVLAAARTQGLNLRAPCPDIDPTRPLGDLLLAPTRIHAPAVVRVLHHYRVKQVIGGMAHVTAGLVPALTRLLGAHFDAKLDFASWTIPPGLSYYQRGAGLSLDALLSTTHAGLGFLMVVRPAFAESIVQQLRRQGELVAVVGKVVKGSGRVLL